MAAVHNLHNSSDSFFFARDQPFYDMPDHLRHDGAFAGYPYGEQQQQQQQQQQPADLVGSTYDPRPAMSAYYDLPPREPNDTLRPAYQRYSPSASPSASMPRSPLDRPPSHYSHTSGHSAASSTGGSPYAAGPEPWMDGLGLVPGIVPMESYGVVDGYAYPDGDPLAFEDKFAASFVDPALIQSIDSPIPHHHGSSAPYPGFVHAFPQPQLVQQPPSPTPSSASSLASHHTRSSALGTRHASPYHPAVGYQPYPPPGQGRHLSRSSSHSRRSQGSPRSSSGFDDEGKERDRCPDPDCRRTVKDLKAHMLTHQSERPEKCPILTCPYHVKGFARKYDRNRHTLTHYKGTMVCGFCPGTGSSGEKSFNRADVFKRHLTTVHGVEQAPPNGRKKSPSGARRPTSYAADATGRCSTCSAIFGNAQDFYEHLDDCVLKSLEQEDPSEAINARHLTQISADEAVRETMERNALPVHAGPDAAAEEDEDAAEADDDDGDDDDDDDDAEAEADETWTGKAAGAPARRHPS